MNLLIVVRQLRDQDYGAGGGEGENFGDLSVRTCKSVYKDRKQIYLTCVTFQAKLFTLAVDWGNDVTDNGQWHSEGRFTHKADSHIACRAHAVPLPCRAAKGLECVFPI